MEALLDPYKNGEEGFSVTAIYFSDFLHHPYVLQPLRLEGWLFPHHQVTYSGGSGR
jgi:hypothetical protein